MEEDKKRLLRPSEQLPLFDISERTVALGMNSTPLCFADPERVLLVISIATANGNAFVSTRASVTPNNGMALTQGFPLIIDNARWGPLTAYAYFGASTMATSVIVNEVFLRRYPKGGMEQLTS